MAALEKRMLEEVPGKTREAVAKQRGQNCYSSRLPAEETRRLVQQKLMAQQVDGRMDHIQTVGHAPQLRQNMPAAHRRPDPARSHHCNGEHACEKSVYAGKT